MGRPVPVVGAICFRLFMGPAVLLCQEPSKSHGYTQFVNEYFVTASVYPQEQGEVQLTTTPFLNSGEATRTGIAVGVEIGLTDRWQVEVQWNPYVAMKVDAVPRVSAPGDLELETRYSFMAVGAASLHAAVGFGVTLPTGDLRRGTTEGFVEYETSVSVAKDFDIGRPLQIFGEVGLGLVQRSKRLPDAADQEPAAHEISVNSGLLVALGSARVLAELNWATNQWNNGGEDTEIYVTPGLIWDLPGTWEVGLGIPIGLSAQSDDFRAILFLLYEFDIGG